jgi:enoyl-CoA hydratase
MADHVITEARGRTLLITLNRPEKKNAINSAMSQGLLAAMAQLDEDPGLSVGVIHGADGCFCAGMDLTAFAKEGPPKGLHTFLRDGSSKPLIAAVEGVALGGGLEVALVCDLLVASRGATLGIPESRVGLFAAGGGLLRLPRRLPYHLAMAMALTARPLTAELAHQHGLLNALVEPNAALGAALELADSVAQNAPLALTASKALIQASPGVSEEDFWQIQIPFVKSVFRSGDAKEGPRAFTERRAPEWQAS